MCRRGVPNSPALLSRPLLSASNLHPRTALAARRRDDYREYLILNHQGRPEMAFPHHAWRARLDPRCSAPASEDLGAILGAIWTRFADRLRKSYLRFSLYKRKDATGPDAGGGTRTPEHADYDSARLWLCRARFRRNGAPMAPESRVWQEGQWRVTAGLQNQKSGGSSPPCPARSGERLRTLRSRA
jgi:hypothetical protein